MIQNYLTVAVRNLRRYWGYTLINVFGLAIALTCALQIASYVRHEYAFNTHLDRDGRVYRLVHLRPRGPDGDPYWTVFHNTTLISQVRREVPGLESAFKMFARAMWVQHGDQSRQGMTCFADTAFIDHLSYAAVEGDPREILRRPGSAMVTVSFARSLFGNADPIGQTVSVDYKWGVKGEWVIQGLLQDNPETTSKQLAVDFITISRPSSMDELWTEPWFPTTWSWVVLQGGVKPEDLYPTLDVIAEGYVDEGEKGLPTQLRLQPFNQIYLRSETDYGVRARQGIYGDINDLRLFVSAGALLLLIAAANFINLTTARAEGRGIEVGVRKAVGASRWQLITQFLTESSLIALLAAGIALVGSRLVLAPLSTYLGKTTTQPDLWVSLFDLVPLTLLQLLVSCSYPALYLSGLRPTAALSGREQQKRGLTGRTSLVVFQFTISAVLIVSTLAMSRQMSLISETDLGYDQEQLIWIPLGWADRTLAERRDIVRGAAERHPSVLSATCASTTVGRYSPNIRFQVGPENRREETIDMPRILSDQGFLKTIGLTLVDGADFSRDEGQECLLNEEAVRMLRMLPSGDPFEGGSPIGHRVWMGGWMEVREIVGVIKDFHNSSLHHPNMPLVINNYPEFNLLTVRVAAGRMAPALAHLEQTWKSFVPDKPFKFFFLSDDYAKFYAKEITVQRGLSLTAVLTIFTACLGVLGLAAFIIRQRVKEVGIRRTLGASESSIFVLLSSSFLRLVLIANVIAIPVAWYGLDRWLNNFAYRIPLDPSIFVLGTAVSLLFALAAVAWQARSAAQMHPVDALRVQ